MNTPEQKLETWRGSEAEKQSKEAWEPKYSLRIQVIEMKKIISGLEQDLKKPELSPADREKMNDELGKNVRDLITLLKEFESFLKETSN